MEDNVKIIQRDGYVIVINEDDKGIPLDCPVCTFIMNSPSDIVYYEKYKCCELCGIRFAEGHNRQKWLEGWRPSKDILDAEIKRRIDTPISFR